MRQVGALEGKKRRTLRLDLGVDTRPLSDCRHDHAQEPVRATQRRVDERADADQAAGDGKLQLVLLGQQRHDATPERPAGALARGLVARNDARADLDLHPDLEDALQDGPAGDAALELVHARPGLVDVKRTDDDHARVGGKVVRGRSNLCDGLDDGVNVEPELGRDGDDGCQPGSGA